MIPFRCAAAADGGTARRTTCNWLVTCTPKFQLIVQMVRESESIPLVGLEHSALLAVALESHRREGQIRTNSVTVGDDNGLFVP